MGIGTETGTDIVKAQTGVQTQLIHTGIDAEKDRHEDRDRQVHTKAHLQAQTQTQGSIQAQTPTQTGRDKKQMLTQSQM